MFSLWWKSHNSQAQLDLLFQVAKPMLFGDRVWKPPQAFRQAENDKLMKDESKVQQ
jgi:hypothetical protein